MLKEIYEQPRILGDIFAHYIDFENYTIKTTLDEKPSDINIVACGTSFMQDLWQNIGLSKRRAFQFL